MKFAREPTNEAPAKNGVAQSSFIIFVDRMFTTFIQPPFTNVFDAIAQITADSCLYPARNGD